MIRWVIAPALLCLVAGTVRAASVGGVENLEASYRFLVTDRAQGGVLYQASVGKLTNLSLPLSFYDTAQYWAQHVCEYPSMRCAVTDVYSNGDYTLRPPQSPAGDLQTERVNFHNGSNIYDAATWQIAVMLGEVRQGYAHVRKLDAWRLVNNQNRLLTLGYSGDAPHIAAGANRATTTGERFLYNGSKVTDAAQAYAFRMLGRSWLSDDPLVGAPYDALVSVYALPANNKNYTKGKISWTDWKPFTGENAWAFMIGPLQSAYIHHVLGQAGGYVPFDDIAVQNALKLLPTFTAMQSDTGGVYYAPSGTVRNQGLEPVDPYEVAVENNASLYAGLNILQFTLRQQLAHEKNLQRDDVDTIHRALQDIRVMIDGGRHRNGHNTDGLLAFFRQRAWVDGEFVQGGIANKPKAQSGWMPSLHPKAVDANTWTIAALGASQVDDWFGFGASFNVWQRIKRWGAYGHGKTLMGVGFSDVDGNGIDDKGDFRAAALSAEWTVGAINMLRNMTVFYQSVADKTVTDEGLAAAKNAEAARTFVASLQQDETAMLSGVQQLRYENYLYADFAGRPDKYRLLVPQLNQPYLYADRRYLVPFGWYANPLPSTCATSWMVMLANRFDPLRPGGGLQ